MTKVFSLVLVGFLFGQAATAVCPGQVTATQDSAIVLPYEFEATGNPIIRHIYTADPAVLVEGDTLWLFAGHDESTTGPGYKMRDWQLFSTTDLRHWTQHPCPLTVDDFAWATSRQAYAGHVARGTDGRYYWYVSTNTTGIGVAVSDKITGPYKDALVIVISPITAIL